MNIPYPYLWLEGLSRHPCLLQGFSSSGLYSAHTACKTLSLATEPRWTQFSSYIFSLTQYFREQGWSLRFILNPLFPWLAASDCSPGLAGVIPETLFCFIQLETWLLFVVPKSLDQSGLGAACYFSNKETEKLKKKKRKLCLYLRFTFLGFQKR